MGHLKPLHFFIIFLFIVIFVAHALSISFTQDDAFISYRYVKNFLNGDGLVFNQGERVEGYTNFFFIIIMALFGRLGLDYIIISKIVGIMSGAFILALAFFWSEKFAGDGNTVLLPTAVLLLLAANSALAYWSISGLETVFFAALVFYGLYLATERDFLFIPILALATLTRPEGGLVFGLILIYYLAVRACRFGTLAVMAVIYCILILPQFIFRWYYYGDLLPNPFYAKTGWSTEYFMSGLGYIWLFLKNYGFLGLLALIPIVFVKFIPVRLRMLLFIVIAYGLYIIMVGGDVLHGYRFFIVLIPMMYLLFSVMIFRILRKMTKNKSRLAVIVFAVIFFAAGAATYVVPYTGLRRVRDFEKGLISIMTRQAEIIAESKGSEYTIAMTTIGAFSYYSGANVIDMLGLTDRTIARNPEPFWGITSTWKERNYNVPYIMKRKPDLILFSTGLKPSAPAEKALFLSSEFRRGYYPVFHVAEYMYTIYKRRKDYHGPDNYYNDPKFINLYTDALNYNKDGKYDLAFESASQSAASGPSDFYLPVVLMGDIMLEKGRVEQGIEYLQKAFDMSDGHASTAGDKLGRYYELIGDTAKADTFFNAIRNVNRL